MNSSLQPLFHHLATAATEEQLRFKFMDWIGEYFEVQRWGIYLNDEQNNLLSCDIHGVSDAFVERYQKFGKSVDPVMQYVIEYHAPAHEELVLPKGQWKQSELYLRCCSQYNHEHILTSSHRRSRGIPKHRYLGFCFLPLRVLLNCPLELCLSGLTSRSTDNHCESRSEYIFSSIDISIDTFGIAARTIPATDIERQFIHYKTAMATPFTTWKKSVNLDQFSPVPITFILKLTRHLSPSSIGNRPRTACDYESCFSQQGLQ